jgi:hypothetical protein
MQAAPAAAAATGNGTTPAEHGIEEVPPAVAERMQGGAPPGTPRA